MGWFNHQLVKVFFFDSAPKQDEQITQLDGSHTPRSNDDTGSMVVPRDTPNAAMVLPSSHLPELLPPQVTDLFVCSTF